MTQSRDPLTNPRYVAGFWIGYTILSLNQSFVWAAVANRERAWHEPVPWAVATALVWGLLTPLIVRLARAKRLDRATWKRHLPWYITGWLMAGLLDAAADQGARIVAGMPFAFWPDYFRKLDVVAFYYAIIVGVTHAYDYYRLFRERELRASQLENDLRQSQLQLLKSQLQPHFLFNTLNAVNALIYEDPKAADRMVTRLADLLRMSLAAGNAQEISLEYELEFVRAYLDIQQTRLGARLRMVIDVPEHLYHASVPTLLLQPLVENAVLHGIAPLVRGGMITVQAAEQDGRLHVTVADTGAGIQRKIREGIGLANLRERLQQLYGENQSLAIIPNEPAGTRIEISFPYRTTTLSGAVWAEREQVAM
jgi:two-component system LytT family sensor kinase